MPEPDSKDTGEKPWPTLSLTRSNVRDVPAVFHNEGGDTEERYVPLGVIRERLKDEEIVDKGLDAMAASERRHGYANFALEAAVEAMLDDAFSKEEGP